MHNTIYSSDQWAKDREFKAEPGQEITAEIYDNMLNVLPPRTLPDETVTRARNELKRTVNAGFLMGEPHSHNKEGALYLAFGCTGSGNDTHYYYLGLSHERKQKRITGNYYYMDCMNCFVNSGLFPESEFKDDEEAIRTAADYEATLYKYEYRDGKRINSNVLYEP